MSPLKLKHVYRSKDRQGRSRWLLRLPGCRAVTLKGVYGSPDFMANYQAAIANRDLLPTKGIGGPGTVAALARVYFASAAFAGLAAETRRHRRTLIEDLGAEHGDKRVSTLLTKHVRSMVDAKASTPGQARNLLGAISALMAYAIDMGLRDDNPCRGIKRPRLRAEGWHSWTDEEIDAFRQRHPLGTKPRLALELLLCSMQRRSDVVKLGRQHVREGLIHITQQKTGQLAYAQISQELQAALDSMPITTLTFLVTSEGKPFTPGGFTHWFRHRCIEAGLPSGCSVHGLRKAGARIAVESGCDVHEVAAIGGWKSLRELQRYTAAFDRKRAARSAADKIRKATSTYTHNDQRSHTEKKA